MANGTPKAATRGPNARLPSCLPDFNRYGGNENEQTSREMAYRRVGIADLFRARDCHPHDDTRDRSTWAANELHRSRWTLFGKHDAARQLDNDHRFGRQI